MDSHRPEPAPQRAASPIQGKRALILSGDAREQEHLQGFLQGWGMDAQIALNPVHAMARVGEAAEGERGFDLVLFSTRGHHVTGEQFAAVLRSDSRLRRLPLIHLGDPMGPAHEAALRKAGFVEVIPAPLDKTLLFDSLHRVWGVGPAEPGVARLLDRYKALGPSIPPLDILLAEPDKAQRALACRALAPGGHHIFEVDNGEQALEALNGHSFDLVLIALDLPGIGGAETVRLFHFSRAREDWPPFVALADHPGPSEVQDCRRADMAAIVHKPVQPQALLQTLARVLRLGTAEERANGATAKPGGGVDGGLPVVDEQVLRELERLGSDPAFLSGLIEEFLAEVGALVRRTRESCGTAGFHSGLLQLGHTLKDSAGNLGAVRLYQLGLTACHLSAPSLEQEGEHVLEQIERSFDRTRTFFREYMELRGISGRPS